MKFIVVHSEKRSGWCIAWQEDSNASSYIVSCPEYGVFRTKEVAQVKCKKLNEDMKGA